MNLSLFSILIGSNIQGQEVIQGGKESNKEGNFFGILKGLEEENNIPFDCNPVYNGMLSLNDRNNYQFNSVSPINLQDNSNQFELFNNTKHNIISPTTKEIFTPHNIIRNIINKAEFILDEKLKDILPPAQLDYIKNQLERIETIYNPSENSVIIPVLTPIITPEIDDIKNNITGQVSLKIAFDDFLRFNKEISDRDISMNEIITKSALFFGKENFKPENLLYKDLDNSINIPILIPFNFSNEELNNNTDERIYLNLKINDYLKHRSAVNGESQPILITIDNIPGNDNNRIFNDNKTKDNNEIVKNIFSDMKTIFDDSSNDKNRSKNGILNISELRNSNDIIVNIPLEIKADSDADNPEVSLSFISGSNNFKGKFDNNKDAEPVKVYFVNNQDVIKTDADDNEIIEGIIRVSLNGNEERFSYIENNEKKIDSSGFENSETIKNKIAETVINTVKNISEDVNKVQDLNPKYNINEIVGIEDKSGKKLEISTGIDYSLYGNLFINPEEIKNIDDKVFQIQTVISNSEDKNISILIPKESLDILKYKLLESETANSDREIGIPVIVRENKPEFINNNDNKINNSIFQDEEVKNLVQNEKVEYSPNKISEPEIAKTNILRVNLSDIRDVGEGVKKLPFEIFSEDEIVTNDIKANIEYKLLQIISKYEVESEGENEYQKEDLLQVIRNHNESHNRIENKIFEEVKTPIEIDYRSVMKINKKGENELYILMNENKNQILEINNVLIDLKDINKAEDGSLNIPIKILSDSTDDNNVTQEIGNSKIYIPQSNIENIKTNMKEIAENSRVRVPIEVVSSENKENKIIKMAVETEKNVMLEIFAVNNEEENLSKTEGAIKPGYNNDNNISNENTGQIRVKLVLTMNREYLETPVNKVKHAPNFSGDAVDDFNKEENVNFRTNIDNKDLFGNKILNTASTNENNKGIFENKIINFTEVKDVPIKTPETLVNTDKKINSNEVKKSFEIPVEVYTEGHKAEAGKEAINAKIVVEKNISNGSAAVNVNGDVNKVEQIDFINFQRINFAEKSSDNLFSSSEQDFLNGNKEKNDFDGIKINNIIGIKEGGFIKELSEVENSSIKDNTLSRNVIIENNIEKIVNEARMIMRKGRREISMELEPKELGKMSMKIVMERSKLIAKIIVESREAKNLFTESVSKLTESLNENGIQIERIDITIKNGQNNFERNNFSEDKSSFHGNFKENRRNDYDNYDEKDRKSGYMSRNMGYNTIELVA